MARSRSTDSMFSSSSMRRGSMADGDWSIAAYIDQRADDGQTEALAAIFTGAAGGPMAAFTPLITRTWA